MVSPLCTILLSCLPSLAGGEGVADAAGVRYAALPMRNLTASVDAVATILDRCRTALEARGASFVPPAELDDVLRTRRIRYTDSLSAAAARDVRESTGADFVLVGTLFTFESAPLPHLSVALRIIDTASDRRVQSAVVTLRGEDFAGLLGLGVIEDMDELVEEALVRLLDLFDARGAPRPDRRGEEPGGRRVPSSSLSLFVRDDFDAAAVERLGVLPLSNRTRRLGAGLVFSEILGHELFRRAGIQVLEQSELRASMVRQRIRSVEGLDLDVLRAIGGDLGTRYFALGSIDRFREETFIEGDRFPEIEAFVRIIDVQEGGVVASVGIHRTGFDYEGLLELGGVKDPVALAARVASEMIASIGIGE